MLEPEPSSGVSGAGLPLPKPSPSVAALLRLLILAVFCCSGVVGLLCSPQLPPRCLPGCFAALGVSNGRCLRGLLRPG